LRIECSQCAIRTLRADDATAIARHANNPNVSRWLRDIVPYPYAMADAQAWIAGALAARPQSTFAIEVGGEAVGAINYIPGEDIERYSVEIGYWLGEPFWGRGIATAAVKLFCDYCFTELNLLRLYALPFGDNPGSLRVLEKAGFTREGVLKAAVVKRGVVHDYVIYARINPHWKPPADLNAE